MYEILEYLEKELQRVKKIYEPIEKLMESGDATETQMWECEYYQGYADGIAASINNIHSVWFSMVEH
jgi:hypothetical protein